MFACRVLVGQYTKGESHYRRPPVKDAAGNLYDSCVNDVREPTIYVVFERSQAYPEFLIIYEKSRFPKDINIIQSNRTTCVLATPKSDLSIHSKPTQGLISLSRLLKESAQSLSTSTTTPVFSNADNLLITAKPSLTDNSIQSGIAKNQQETLTIGTSNLVTGRSQISQQESQNSAPLRSLEFDKSVIDSLDPFSCSSDKAKIFDASSTTYLSEIESKTSVPSKTTCSSAHKQCPSDGSLSESLISFYESRSSENVSQSFDVFDDTFNVSQTASVIRTSSPHKAYNIASGSTSTGEEVLTSKPAQGLTSLSCTGLPRTSAQDLLTPVKIPVSSHSDNQLSISGKPSLTDRSTSSKVKPNRDLVTIQTSQGSQQDSQKPVAHKGVVTNFSNPLMTTPSPTARARNPSSEASSASSHSAKERKISVMYTTSSPSADKQSHSDSSLSSSSLSFYEMQPSALSSTQTHPKSTSPQQASHQKNVLEAQSVQKKKCVMQ